MEDNLIKLLPCKARGTLPDDFLILRTAPMRSIQRHILPPFSNSLRTCEVTSIPDGSPSVFVPSDRTPLKYAVSRETSTKSDNSSHITLQSVAVDGDKSLGIPPLHTSSIPSSKQ